MQMVHKTNISMSLNETQPKIKIYVNIFDEAFRFDVSIAFRMFRDKTWDE